MDCLELSMNLQCYAKISMIIRVGYPVEDHGVQALMKIHMSFDVSLLRFKYHARNKDFK